MRVPARRRRVDTSRFGKVGSKLKPLKRSFIFVPIASKWVNSQRDSLMKGVIEQTHAFGRALLSVRDSWRQKLLVIPLCSEADLARR